MTSQVLVAGVSAIALLADVQSAHAADAAPAPAAPASAQVEEVIVTGSRIQNPSMTSPTPMTVLGAEQIKQTSPSTVDDVLQQLPQLRPDSGPSQLQRNTGAISTSQSFANLRGLGAQRTLVLINGQRPVPTNAQGTTSTSIIPLGLINRVDAVTGGASAAYGSDAVAGVVNFVLKDRMEGVQGAIFGGISQQGDNKDFGFNLAGGTSAMGGRLHLEGGVDYDNNKGIGNIYSRDWSKNEPGNSGTPISFGANRPAGSPALGWASGVEYAAQTPGGVINTARTATGATTSLLNQLAFNPDGSTFALVRGPVFGNLMINSSSNHIATPIAQWQLKEPVEQVASLGRASYDISDNTEAFLSLGYAHSSVFAVSQFHQTPTDTILVSNPYLPAALKAQMVANNIAAFDMGRVDTEWLGTSGDNRSDTFQLLTGFRGKLMERFNWDLTYAYGRSVLDSHVYGTREANLAAAEYAVTDASGNIVCGPLATNPNFAANRLTNTIQPGLVQPGCVPLNPFGVGNSSAAARAYAAGIEYTTDVMLRHDVAFNISGPIFTLPAGPIDAAAGAEYRYDSLDQRADELQQLGLYSSGNNKSFSGENDVKEVYAEVEVPLLKDMTLAKSLGFNGAIRYTDYKTSGAVTTWKVGGTWEPLDGLRFRITSSRDIRAPSLFDLFNTGAFSATGSFTNPFNGQSARLPQQTAGNPNLKPEKADTFTAGVTYQAHDGWLAGAQFSLDYYHIEVNDVIASVAATDILQRCYQGVTIYCSAITFDNSTFGIAKITVQPFNQSKLLAEGVDIQVSYHHDLAPWGLPGSFDVSTFATNLMQLKTTDRPGPAGITTDNAGYQGGAPKWVVNAFLNYHLDPYTIGLQVRGFTDVGYSPVDIGPGQTGYSPALPNSINKNIFPGLVYFNLNGAYDFKRWGRNFQLFGNIYNLFDRDPPSYAIAAINLGGNPYDYVGRTFKFGLRFNF
jgi:outer membrane receptor protein involved in Fe transport